MFQIKANELHAISNRLYWGLAVVLKINDEIYVSISIGKYLITFHLFSVLYQGRYFCWKYRKWGSHLKNRYNHAKVVENSRINFPISPYCTCCFLEKRTSNFWKYLCQLFIAIAWLTALWMFEDISIEMLPIPHWTFTCFSKNGHKSTQGAKFVQTYQVYYENWL